MKLLPLTFYKRLPTISFQALSTGLHQQLGAVTQNRFTVAKVFGSSGFAQQLLQLLFAVKLRQAAYIFAVEVQKIENIPDKGVASAPVTQSMLQGLKAGSTGWLQDNRF